MITRSRAGVIRDMTDPLRPTPKPAPVEEAAYSDPMTGFMVAP